MTEKLFRETLPNDIEELKDIVEIQLAKIKALQDKINAYNGNFVQIKFNGE